MLGMLMEGKTAGAEEGFVGWLKPSHECKESGQPSLPQWQSIMRGCYSRSVQDAGVPLQTGTVAVERWWSSLKQMLPNEARCVSSRWFQVLARLAFLRHNIRHFQAGSTVPWADGDPLLSQRIQFFEDCARMLQQTDDKNCHPIFEKFVDP